MAHLLLHQLPCHHFSSPSLSWSHHLRYQPSTISNASMVQFFAHRGFHLPYPHSITTTIKCMANPRRVKMVAKQIRRELSHMLLTDKNLQYAVLPEAALGADRYISALTTISDVEVSADLQVVKVYVSIFGDERGRDVAIAGLKAKAKYVRSQLGKRMKLRLTPEIRFIEDESLERGSRVIAILDKIKSENEKRNSEDHVRKEDSSELPFDEDRDDDDDDDADEDIIYVN
ncbi:hypothetical protein Ancab_023894 [Ancistrocladus abbreviatus]